MDGLNNLHGMGYYHRDIKPENIFIEKLDNGGFNFVYGDFGTVHNHDIATDKSVEAIGTAGYVS